MEKLHRLFSIVAVILVGETLATEEVHSFELTYKGAKIHGVLDMDVEENWLSHHIFANSISQEVTIARDHGSGIEIYQVTGQKACYARLIPSDSTAVWVFKSMFEVQEEHHFNMSMPRIKQEEFLECTNKTVPHSHLGKVAYLCEDLPVFLLRRTRLPVKTTDEQAGIQSGKRTKRNLDKNEDDCYLCGGCCGNEKPRRKRDLLAVELCTKITYLKGCPPRSGKKPHSHEEKKKEGGK